MKNIMSNNTAGILQESINNNAYTNIMPRSISNSSSLSCIFFIGISILTYIIIRIGCSIASKFQTEPIVEQNTNHNHNIVSIEAETKEKTILDVEHSNSSLINTEHQIEERRDNYDTSFTIHYDIVK